MIWGYLVGFGGKKINTLKILLLLLDKGKRRLFKGKEGIKVPY